MRTAEQILKIINKEIDKEKKDQYKIYVPYQLDLNFQNDELDQIFKALEMINDKGEFEATYNPTFMEFHLLKI